MVALHFRNGRFGPLAAMILVAVSMVIYSESAAIPESTHCTRSCRCYQQEDQFAANCSSLSGISSISSRLEVLRLTRFDDHLSIKPGAFSQLPNLRELHLDHLSLVKVYPGAFKGLESLEVLDLADNSLSVGTEVAKAVRDVPNLRRLILRGNNFGGEHAQIPILASRTLKFLDLGRCKLRNLPPQVFTSLHHLRHIVLSGNFIRRFNASAFPPSVVSIDLSNNDIEFISKSELMKLDKVDTVELAGNPIRCNCELLKLSYDYNMEKAVVCAYPKQLMGKNLVDLTKQQMCGGKGSHGKKQKRQAENEIDAEGEVLSEDEEADDMDAEPSEAYFEKEKVHKEHTKHHDEEDYKNEMDGDINDGHEDENEFREPELRETPLEEGKESYDDDDDSESKGHEEAEADAAENTDVLPDEFGTDGLDDDDDFASDINAEPEKSHGRIKETVGGENVENEEIHMDDRKYEEKNDDYSEDEKPTHKNHGREKEEHAESSVDDEDNEAEETELVKGITAAEEDPEEGKHFEDPDDNIDYEEAEIPIGDLDSRAESGSALKTTENEGENPLSQDLDDNISMIDVENVGKESLDNLGFQPEETPDESDNDSGVDGKNEQLDEHDDVETVHDNENIVRTSDVGARTENNIPSSELQKESNVHHKDEVEGSGEDILIGTGENTENGKENGLQTGIEHIGHVQTENVEDEDEEVGTSLKEEEKDKHPTFDSDLKEEYEDASETEAPKNVETLVESIENKKESSHDQSTEQVVKTEDKNNSGKENDVHIIGSRITNKEDGDYEDEYAETEEKTGNTNNEEEKIDKSVTGTGNAEFESDKSLKKASPYLIPHDVSDYEEPNFTENQNATKDAAVTPLLTEQESNYDENIIPGHNIPKIDHHDAGDSNMVTDEKDDGEEADDFEDTNDARVPEETPLNSWGSAEENPEDPDENTDADPMFPEHDVEEVFAEKSYKHHKPPGASSVMAPIGDNEGSGSEALYDDDDDDSDLAKKLQTTPEANEYEDDLTGDTDTEHPRKISPENSGLVGEHHNVSNYEDEHASGSQKFSDVTRVHHPDVLDEDISNETEVGSGSWPVPGIIMRKEHPETGGEDDDVYEGSGFIPVTVKGVSKDVSSEVTVVEDPESEHPMGSPVDYDYSYEPKKDVTTLKPVEEPPLFPDRNIPQFALPPQNEDEQRADESVEEGSEEPPTETVVTDNWREGKALAPIAASAPTGTVEEAPAGDTDGNKTAEESQNNAGSYVVLGVIMAIIVLLLAYAVVRSRRQKSAANKEKDAENPGRELQDVSKPLINNHNHASEKQPLDETREPLMTPKEKEASLTVDPTENGQKPILADENDAKRKSRSEPNGDVPEVQVEPTAAPHVAATPTEEPEERPATPPGHTNGNAVPVANGGPPSPPPSPATPPPQSSPSQPQPISPGAVRVVAKELPDSVAKRPVIIVNRGADQQQV